MEAQTLTFANSTFWPVAIGFFGLGVGYFIWGGQALFNFPKSTPDVNRTMGLWGFWMPGFMQFLTGIILIVGLTWFGVFGSSPPLYMADHPQSYRSRNQIHGQYKHLQMRWRFGICQFARALSLLDSFA
jgi:hypothetical protein